MSAQPAERALDLVQRHIDGLLDEAGRRELEALLRESPEARAVYVRELKLHAFLHFSVVGATTRELPLPKGACAPASKPRSGRRETARRLSIQTWWYAAAACVALGVVVLIALRESGPQETGGPAAKPDLPTPGGPTVAAATLGRIGRTMGEVAVLSGTSRKAPPKGMELHAGDRIETTKGAEADLLLADGSTVRVMPETSVQLEAGQERSIVRVAHGAIDAQVKPQTQGSFRIVTPFAESSALGTRFMMLANEQRSRLEVLEGQVRFTFLATGESRIVNKDEAFDLDAKGRFAANLPPTVSVKRPQAGATFAQGEPIEFEPDAADPENRIKWIELRIDGAWTTTCYAPPWLFVLKDHPPGTYKVTFKVCDGVVRVLSPAVSFTVTGSGAAEVRQGKALRKLFLYDVKKRAPVPGFDPLQDGATLDLAKLPADFTLQLDADASGIGSVVWNLNDQARLRVENGAPFGITKNNPEGWAEPWKLAAGQGCRLKIEAFAEKDGKGKVLETLSLTVRVVDSRKP